MNVFNARLFAHRHNCVSSSHSSLITIPCPRFPLYANNLSLWFSSRPWLRIHMALTVTVILFIREWIKWNTNRLGKHMEKNPYTSWHWIPTQTQFYLSHYRLFQWISFIIPENSDKIRWIQLNNPPIVYAMCRSHSTRYVYTDKNSPIFSNNLWNTNFYNNLWNLNFFRYARIYRRKKAFIDWRIL